MLNDLITKSIEIIKAKKINVYSYSIYYSHEDRKYSVCVDTYENSIKKVKLQRKSDAEFLEMILESRDYDLLATTTNSGNRNFSLGDYKYVNLIESSSKCKISKKIVIENVICLRNRCNEIAKYSKHGSELLFSVTSLIDEFGICWYSNNSKIRF